MSNVTHLTNGPLLNVNTIKSIIIGFKRRQIPIEVLKLNIIRKVTVKILDCVSNDGFRSNDGGGNGPSHIGFIEERR